MVGDMRLPVAVRHPTGLLAALYPSRSPPPLDRRFAERARSFTGAETWHSVATSSAYGGAAEARGKDHATRNGRSRSDGCEHGPALDGQGPSMRRLRRVRG